MNSIAQKTCIAASVLFALSNSAHAQSTSFSFAGPYVGVFGGYGSGTSSQHDNGFIYTPPVVAAAPGGGGGGGGGGGAGDGNYGLHGGLGGGLIGYNQQIERLVVGAEADIGGTAIKGGSSVCGIPAHQCGTSIGFTSDIRGRIGLPYGAFMPFIAGGLALASISANDSLFGANGRATQAGYTIGGGVEYKISPVLSLRLEYLHADFGTRTLFAIVPGVPERVSTTTDVVRAGITYSFFTPTAGPVVARY